MNSALQRRFISHLLRIVVLIFCGTVGYMLIEHWRFLDSLYMTVETLFTVGFGEVAPLSDAGKVYTMIVIFTGVGMVLYILRDIVEIYIEANPTAIFGLRRMKQKIGKLSDHQIVCGFGRTGQEVSAHFLQQKFPFVVIEADPTQVKRAEEAGFLVIQGDATSDEALNEAYVSRAKGIVCALPDDTANTFIALSARVLNEEITIVCRAANPGSEAKMMRAGAHMVISPYVIGGRRMATAVTHPLVMEFLDVAMHSPGYDLRLEQVVIKTGSQLVNGTLKDSNLKQISGAMILAVKQSGKLITNPSPELFFHSGDELVALGTDEELKKLADLADATGAHTAIT